MGEGDSDATDEVEEISETIAEALGGAEESMGERDDPGDEIVSTARDVAAATSDAAETAGEIRDAIDAVERGDVSDAVSETVGAVGAAGGGVGSLADAIGHVAGEPAAEVLGAISGVANTVGGIAEAIGGPVRDVIDFFAGKPEDAVSFEFECEALADAEWKVDTAALEERLDAPYSLELRLESEDGDLDVSELLGSACTFTIKRKPDIERPVRGIVHRVTESSLRANSDKTVVSLGIGPAAGLLALRRDTRIFQNKTAPEILEEVLTAGLSPYGRECRLELDDTYLMREYCVQYEESDLAFATRLMQEEGIAHRYDHEPDAEVLVLVDRNSAYPRAETLDDAAIPFLPTSDVVRGRENISVFHAAHHLGVTKVVARDFDWTQQDDMIVEAECEGGEGEAQEDYSHHARVLTITDYDQGVAKYQRHDADRQAQIRHELHALARDVASGIGRVITFCPGMTFELVDHPNAGVDGEYLITKVIHEKRPLPDSEEGRAERYHNRFECIPLSVPYRPAQLADKPRIHSMQTAVVTGPDTEEIHTDEHGRIKVQFHWDRLGELDDRSSCWVRVQQPWAGAGWGFVFIPRVGMEVIVSFLDGDPDRPLVVGSAYNGTNLPPYPLPDEKTKSTIKTNSSPGGDGFNELRFEDAKGNEEIFTHAQKDYNEVVEHDHTTTVHNDQTNTVDGNQTQTIGVDQTELVRGQQTMTVEKNRTVHIVGSQDVNIDGAEPNGGVSGSKLNITGDYKVDVSDWIEVQAPTHIKFTCGGSEILMEPGKISLTAGGRAHVVLDANALMKSAAGSQVLLDGNAEMAANAGAITKLTAKADMKSSAGSQVLLDGNAKVAANSGANMVLTADAKISGTNSELIGSSTGKVGAPTATLAGGGGSVEAGGAGVTAAGGKIAISGGMVDVAGGVVKIN